MKNKAILIIKFIIKNVKTEGWYRARTNILRIK